MPNIGIWELLLVLVLALLFFGPKSIPQIGKAIGEGIKEFKKSQSRSGEEEQAGDKEGTPPPS
jgi:sec-independent protein translocase protein TatA